MTNDPHSARADSWLAEDVLPDDLPARFERLQADLDALKRQHRLYETIVRDLPTGLAILDRDLVYRKVNALYARYFDRPIAYIEGRRVFDLVPGSQIYIEELLHRALAGEEIHRQQHRVVFTDDRGRHETYWDFSYAPLLDGQGHVDGVIVLAREVSARVRMTQELEERQRILEQQRSALSALLEERRRAEAELKESEERYRAIFERAPVGILQTDLEGRIIGCNPAFEHMLGYTREELSGLEPGTLVHPDERDAVAAFLQGVVAGQPGPQHLEKRCLRKAGGYISSSLDVSLIRDAQGEPSSVLWLVEDVTERKRAEDRLINSKRQLKQAQAIAHLGSWEWDPQTGELSWSDELFRILGYEPGTLVPSVSTFLKRVPPEDQYIDAKIREAITQSSEPLTLEHRIIRSDGEERIVRLVVQASEPIDGRPPKLMGVVQDITEQRLLERMKDEFISMVSHELRTPLTSIRAPLLLLANGTVSSESPQGREMVNIAARSAERMVRLVNDILDMQRLATGQLRIRPGACDAADLIRQAIETMQPLADEADVKLQASAEALALHADGTRIVQVLTNLLDNAVSFSPPGGTVRVSLERQGGQAVFCVSDEGPGVPPQQRELIFERFKQADASMSRSKEGTGLGLAICRALVEQHGGRIWVGDRPGPGATFCFCLPLGSGEPAS